MADQTPAASSPTTIDSVLQETRRFAPVPAPMLEGMTVETQGESRVMHATLRMNGEASASGWIAEHTSWRKPGRVSS